MKTKNVAKRKKNLNKTAGGKLVWLKCNALSLTHAAARKN